MSERRLEQRNAWQLLRSAVKGRAAGRCEAALPHCMGTGYHAHHILRRSQGGPDHPDNLLWVCAVCHGRIHDHPEDAYASGHLRRSGQ